MCLYHSLALHRVKYLARHRYIETKGMTPGNSVGGATPLIMASRFGDVAMVSNK